MTALLRRTALGCLFVLAVACDDSGSSDSDSDPQGKPIAYDQFCAQLAVAVCDGVAVCCNGDAGLTTEAENTCLRRESDDCESGLLGEPSTRAQAPDWYDAQKAGDLLAKTRSAAKSCGKYYYPSANDLRGGDGAVGANCTSNVDCKKTLFCYRMPGATTGGCSERPVEGQECTSACAEGLHCVMVGEDDATGVCTGPRQLGQSCGISGNPCDEGLYCDFPDDTTEDTICLKRLADGQSCDDDFQCTSNNCAGNTICRPAESEAMMGQWCEIYRRQFL